MDKLLALFFSLMILGNAYVVRRIAGTWLFPAVIFALVWFAFTFLPLVVLFDVPVNPWAIAFICAATIFFSLSAMAYFDWKRALVANGRKSSASSYFNTRFLRTLFYGSVFVSLFGFLTNMLIQGFTLESMLNDILLTAGSYATMGYAGELKFNLYSRVGLVASYLAVCLGGLLFGSAESRQQQALSLVGAFLPAILEMVLHSQKGYLFGFISLFFGGILVTRIFAGRLFLIDASTLRAVLLALAVIVPLTILSFLSRGLTGDVSAEFVIEAVSHNIRSYSFGSLYAFADWFSFRTGQPVANSYSVEPTGYGFYTFMSFFRYFGSMREVPLGTYDDFFSYGTVITTNIYTIFRGLIIDFGLVGALLYMYLTGFALHFAYFLLLMKRRPAFTVAIFVVAAAYYYMSSFVSLLGANTIPFITLLFGVCLYVNSQRLVPNPAIEPPTRIYPT